MNSGNLKMNIFGVGLLLTRGFDENDLEKLIDNLSGITAGVEENIVIPFSSFSESQQDVLRGMAIACGKIQQLLYHLSRLSVNTKKREVTIIGIHNIVEIP